jgi:excisionase family DNA binding protein
MDPEHDLLTRPEVAEVLRTPIATLHQWASRGYGPRFLRVGRKALYRRADVEAWLEDQEQERREAVGAP